MHPGAPKTATTALQHVLRVNRWRLAWRGVGLILPEDIRDHSFLGDYLAAYRGSGPSDISQCTAEFFAPYLAKYRTVICSEETLCHDFMPSRKIGLGGIDRADTAARLLSHCGAEQTKVVLSIRPQVDFLTSTYTHFVHRRRESRPFSEWLSHEVDLGSVLWSPAVAAFRQQFGVEAVNVVLLADKGGVAGYIKTMLDHFGLSRFKLKYDVSEIHNPSPSARAVQLCRIMNSQIRNPEKSERVNSALIENFPVEEFGKFVPAAGKIPKDLLLVYAADHAAALSGAVPA